MVGGGEEGKGGRVGYQNGHPMARVVDGAIAGNLPWNSPPRCQRLLPATLPLHRVLQFLVGNPIGFIPPKYLGLLLPWLLTVHKPSCPLRVLLALSSLSLSSPPSHRAMPRARQTLLLGADTPWVCSDCRDSESAHGCSGLHVRQQDTAQCW